MFKFNPKMGMVLALQVLLLNEVLSGKVNRGAGLIQNGAADWKTLVENFKSKLSPDIDPCTNFHSYVCTKYNDSESKDYKNMLVLEPYLEKAVGLSSTEVKAKHYMHSCMHTTEENVEKFVKNFNFEKSTGGWPAYDPNWKSQNFDWQATIAEFASYNLWSPIDATFLDSLSAARNYLYVGVPVSEFYIFGNEPAQIRLNKTLNKTGVKNVNAVLIDAMQFENEYKAAGIPSNWYGPTVLTNFSSLKVEIPELDWDKYIKTKENRRLPDDYSVHILKSDDMRRALTTISKMEPKVVANYLFCRFLLRIPTTEIQRSKEECWDDTHDEFQSVLSQTILNKFVSDEVRHRVIPLINTYVDALEKYLPPPDKATNSKYIKQIVEEYLASLTDDSLIEEYKDLFIDPESYLLNYYTMIRYNSLKYTAKYWNEKLHLSRHMAEQVAIDFPYQIYKVNTKLWTSVYSYIAFHYSAVQLVVINPHLKFNNILSNCFGEDVKQNSVRKAIALQILTRNFINWVTKNENDIQDNNNLLKEYGLNLKKSLFVGAMQFWCKESNLNEVNSIFSKFQEFGDTFNCPVGSPMNPSEKCDIDNFEILA